MRIGRKQYRDENYPDPPVAGYCALCGDPIEEGEPWCGSNGELFHAGGRRCIVEIEGKRKELSCAMVMILRDYTQEDIAEALGLERED